MQDDSGIAIRECLAHNVEKIFSGINAITITRSQDQTLRVVGVRLEESTFTRGQLYIADLRVGEPQHLHFEVTKSVSRKTRKVVHKEIL